MSENKLPTAVTLDLLLHHHIYAKPHPAILESVPSYEEALLFLCERGLLRVNLRATIVGEGRRRKKKAELTYAITSAGTAHIKRILDLPLDGSPEQPKLKFDWRRVSPRLKYIAKDSDSTWWAYSSEPVITGSVWSTSPMDDAVMIPREYAPVGEIYWRESRIDRPT